MECVGIGDLHMTDDSGKGALSKYVQEPDQMVANEVRKVITDYARPHGIDKIFLYGDICDGPRMSYDAMMAFVDLLTENDDMEFHAILGNHDLYSKKVSVGHSMQVIERLYRAPNFKLYKKPTTVQIDGASVRFLPFPHEKFDAEALNVFHKEVRGAKNDAGRKFDGDDFTDSKAVTVAGHLHTAHKVRNTFYAGTLYQNNFGEKLPKYFHHIRFKSVRDYSVDLIEHDPQYKLHNVVLQTRDDLANIPKGQFNLVKLVVQDGADVSAADWADHKNIVETKNFKTKADLQTALDEDILNPKSFNFRPDEWFKEWVKALDVEPSMRRQIRDVRKRVLAKVDK
jgi:hypothetical protein